jgi:hypothetical protein
MSRSLLMAAHAMERSGLRREAREVYRDYADIMREILTHQHSILERCGFERHELTTLCTRGQEPQVVPNFACQ